MTCKEPRFCCNGNGNGNEQECTGRCIPQSWVNDGWPHCANGEDEDSIDF